MKMKNTNTYFNKLIDYCKAVGIDVYTKKDLNNAFYVSVRRIYLDESFKDSLLIAVLLHEIGHFEDELLTSNKKLEELYARAAEKCDKDISMNKKEFDCLIGCETRAWQMAEVLARKLKIPLGKWFYKHRDSALLTYFSAKTHKGVK